jgi:hypothetical protein
MMMTGVALVGGILSPAFSQRTSTSFASGSGPNYELLVGSVNADTGTRTSTRYDYRPLMEGTTLARIAVEGALKPFQRPTRMARIRALAPLSFRDWAPVFDRSHSAIKQWADGEEPTNPKLDQVIDALSEASIFHRDLATWLTSPVPGMAVRPVDLLKEDRWRAFKGAIRAGHAPTVTVEPEELLNRRRSQSSWAVAERPVIVEEE